MNCTFDPTKVTGPIGMFHCPECGEMVLAGVPHLDYSVLPDIPLPGHDAHVMPSFWLTNPKPGYCVISGGFTRTFRNKRKAEKYAKKRYANPW